MLEEGTTDALTRAAAIMFDVQATCTRVPTFSNEIQLLAPGCSAIDRALHSSGDVALDFPAILVVTSRELVFSDPLAPARWSTFEAVRADRPQPRLPLRTLTEIGTDLGVLGQPGLGLRRPTASSGSDAARSS